jgi:hypothetical protein
MDDQIQSETFINPLFTLPSDLLPPVPVAADSERPIDIVRIALQFQGLNTVEFPVGGRLIAVALSWDDRPMLAVLGPRGGETEKRNFFVAEHGCDLPSAQAVNKLDRFVGHAQPPQHNSFPFYVFSMKGADPE